VAVVVIVGGAVAATYAMRKIRREQEEADTAAVADEEAQTSVAGTDASEVIASAEAPHSTSSSSPSVRGAVGNCPPGQALCSISTSRSPSTQAGAISVPP
jgi:hypothetical protein